MASAFISLEIRADPSPSVDIPQGNPAAAAAAAAVNISFPSLPSAGEKEEVLTAQGVLWALEKKGEKG